MTHLTGLFQLHPLPSEGSRHRYEGCINENHPIFAGHFPTMPIVPGVCLIHAVKSAIGHNRGQAATLPKIRECKFLSAINPTVENRFTIDFSLTEENELQATIFVGSTQCMKLKATVSFG